MKKGWVKNLFPFFRLFTGFIFSVLRKHVHKCEKLYVLNYAGKISIV